MNLDTTDMDLPPGMELTFDVTNGHPVFTAKYTGYGCTMVRDGASLEEMCCEAQSAVCSLKAMIRDQFGLDRDRWIALTAERDEAYDVIEMLQADLEKTRGMYVHLAKWNLPLDVRIS
jgi:hypothetical protein